MARPKTQFQFDPNALNELMQRAGVSNGQLARCLNLSQGNLSGYLSGQKRPGIGTLIAIADFFAVPLDYLFGRCDLETAEAVLRDYGANFQKLRRMAYEDGYYKFALARETVPGRYEAPWPYNLVDEIFREPTEFWITPGREAALESVIGTLTEREQAVIDLRFRRGMTLDEVGKELGVTRERVRQIEAKAVRKLRHPSRARLIKTGITTMAAEQEATEKLRELEAQIAQKETVLCWLEAMTRNVQIPEPPERPQLPDETPIEELEFSVRTFNCLWRAGLRKVGDVTAFVEKNGFESLCRIRNLGRKSIDELTAKFKDRVGIDLREKGEEA